MTDQFAALQAEYARLKAKEVREARAQALEEAANDLEPLHARVVEWLRERAAAERKEGQ